MHCFSVTRIVKSFYSDFGKVKTAFCFSLSVCKLLFVTKICSFGLSYVIIVYYPFVFLVVSHLGFQDMVLVLIVPILGHSVYFYILVLIVSDYCRNDKIP